MQQERHLKDTKTIATESTMPREEETEQKIEEDKDNTSKDASDNLCKHKKMSLPNKSKV